MIAPEVGRSRGSGDTSPDAPHKGTLEYVASYWAELAADKRSIHLAFALPPLEVSGGEDKA
eukprot:6728006-Pyramimonas_sp.AAC.1